MDDALKVAVKAHIGCSKNGKEHKLLFPKNCLKEFLSHVDSHPLSFC